MEFLNVRRISASSEAELRRNNDKKRKMEDLQRVAIGEKEKETESESTS